MDGVVPGSCPVACFGVVGVGTARYATRELVKF